MFNTEEAFGSLLYKYPVLGYSKIGYMLWQVKNSIYTSEYKNFLKNLRKARLESALTQIDVAKKLNQHQSYISKCESGERCVDVVELMKFGKLYKKPIEYFVNDIFEND